MFQHQTTTLANRLAEALSVVLPIIIKREKEKIIAKHKKNNQNDTIHRGEVISKSS